MKNYIKDFGQFQRVNEEIEEGRTLDESSWEEVIDAICDGLDEGGLRAHGRTIDEDRAEIIVNGKIFKLEKDYEYVTIAGPEDDEGDYSDSVQFDSNPGYHYNDVNDVIKDLISIWLPEKGQSSVDNIEVDPEDTPTTPYRSGMPGTW